MGMTAYPVAPDPGVAEPIYRAQIVQAMRLRYFEAMKGGEEPLTLDQALEHALATWENDWPTDPQPRTIEMGIQAVDDELAYWTGD